MTNPNTDFQRLAGVRDDGSAFSQIRVHDKQAWGWVGVTAQTAEQQISNTELDLFLSGYTLAPPTSLRIPFPGRVIHGGFHQFDGGLT